MKIHRDVKVIEREDGNIESIEPIIDLDISSDDLEFFRNNNPDIYKALMIKIKSAI